MRTQNSGFQNERDSPFDRPPFAVKTSSLSNADELTYTELMAGENGVFRIIGGQHIR